MDHSKMTEVVIPKLGRSMLTKELFISNDLSNKGKVYHEGYIAGKQRLVEDRTLEMMKNQVNLEMRKIYKTHYKNKSLEEGDSIDFQPLIKLKNFVNEIDWDAEGKDKDEGNKKKDIINLEGDVGVNNLDGLEDNMLNSHCEDEIEACVEHKKYDETETTMNHKSGNSFRFILSGHINGDQAPKYILQEYCGPKLFSGQESNFTSSKSIDGTDVFISGRVFDHNILEENQGKPIALNTGTERILINNNECLVNGSKVNKVFNYNNTADIHVIGDFKRNKNMNFLTPFVSLRVKKHVQDGCETVTTSQLGQKGADNNEPQN